MATPKKTTQGTWRVQIDVLGQRESGTKPTRREAQEWADKRSTELRALGSGKAGTVKTLKDALERYANEVSPTHRGEKWEIVRLAAYAKPDSKLPVRLKLSDLTENDLIAWRDERLKVTARGSVLRDMGLLNAVLEYARRDWKWIKVNPMTDVRRPANPDHREVLITDEQTRLMLESLGYGDKVRTISQAVAVCFLVALATGMRAGELCGLTWVNVHPTYCRLSMTKNGKAREVPLSPEAVRLIDTMRGFDDVRVFGIQSQTLDVLFRRARDRAGLAGFTFHDSRHTAATRMAKLLDVLTLCKVFGWSNTSQALTYFNMPASEIAKLL
jgi:integrase